ncbi:MAG: hypothetical protein GFH27_549293n339 [Chloroflexi bacterium AL-W]|nr:hypothetical protein [Chloroflexi bacterium AL-N1]NOK67546.1 hypothetical protein [Chloroflexi bacterium AL-N10]NOK75684.1 hypothetical protein [Chloroflexi bacterium AL-N5]NOK82472.1 hypothetical protein [Chloroflexi bacterium AL-W]NOK90317.1 hypothetical protein [Chloroflexi bacterium AL-N15]
MYGSTQELIEALQSTPETLETLLSGVTMEQARIARANEGWSIVEVMCHMRDTEEFVIERMHMMRDTSPAMIGSFDQEALAYERWYAQANLQEALAAFVRARSQHIAELAALTPEQWELSAEHNKLGMVTIYSHTLHMLWHDAIHMAQIARQLQVPL